MSWNRKKHDFCHVQILLGRCQLKVFENSQATDKVMEIFATLLKLENNHDRFLCCVHVHGKISL